MSRFSRNEAGPPDVETTVWKCVNSSCQGWMRMEFTFEEHPNCPICNSLMEQAIKLIPQMKPESFRNF